MHADDVGVPRFTCRSCQLKLLREKKKIDRRTGGTLTPWNVPQFEPPAGVDLTFTRFLTSLSFLANQHGFINCSDTSQGVYVMLSKGDGEILKKIVISKDKTWNVYFKGRCLPKTSPVMVCGEEYITYEMAEKVFKDVSSLKGCEGNQDFPLIMNKHKGNTLAGLNDGRATVLGYKHGETVRSINCPLLIDPKSPTKCASCDSFRPFLRSHADDLEKQEQAYDQHILQFAPIAEKYGFINCSGPSLGVFVIFSRGKGDPVKKIIIERDMTWRVDVQGLIVPEFSSVLEKKIQHLSLETCSWTSLLPRFAMGILTSLL